MPKEDIRPVSKSIISNIKTKEKKRLNEVLNGQRLLQKEICTGLELSGRR
jgi:hypothetical protein